MTTITIIRVPDCACVGSEEVVEGCPCREVSEAENIAGRTELVETLVAHVMRNIRLVLAVRI